MVVRAICSACSNTVTAVLVGRLWVEGAGRANDGELSSMLVSSSAYWEGAGVEY
jgi:hypothetical protein